MERPILSAEIVAIGTELTTGATRDSNSGDLAADLTARGVAVARVTTLPDRFDAVCDAIRGALERVDLVITTGGLGPTPDDLTREAIASVCGSVPEVDPELERWLASLFERRGLVMSDSNRKQAWLIPDATALPNAAGTAPGWWVDRSDGRVIVALPGPPSEMRPIWRDGAIPRLRARGLGDDRATMTLRLTGIGESALADLIGEELLRATNPEIATYVRPDAVEVRVSAVGTDGRAAVRIVDEALAGLLPRLSEYVFARGDETWIDALATRLRGRSLAIVEIGTAGQLTALLGAAPWLLSAETVAPGSPRARSLGDLRRSAERARTVAPADVGLAVRARERGGDTAVTVAIAIDGETSRASRTAFQRGDSGRRRAALVACAELWRRLSGEGGA
jgi:nicotinamide-nucleotide amidase